MLGCATPRRNTRKTGTTARAFPGPESLHAGPWWARWPLGSARHHARSAASREAKAKLNHPAIFVSDLDRSIALYHHRAFGFEVAVRWTSRERVAAGETWPMNLPGAHLVDRDGDRIELRHLCGMCGREHTQNSMNHFGLGVADVVAAYATAVAAGVKPDLEHRTVTSVDQRVDTAFVRGCDDERIELLRFH